MQFEKLSFDVVPDIYEKKDQYFEDECVDLKSLKVIDAAGMAFLVKWAKSREDRKLKLLNTPSDVINLIKTYRLNVLFEIVN